MFLRVDISNLVPAVFADIVAILTAPAVYFHACSTFLSATPPPLVVKPKMAPNCSDLSRSNSNVSQYFIFSFLFLFLPYLSPLFFCSLLSLPAPEGGGKRKEVSACICAYRRFNNTQISMKKKKNLQTGLLGELVSLGI
jgi:hypothetical protein